MRLAIRRDHDRYRYENEWPIARTRWTTMYLDAAGPALSPARPSDARAVSYGGESDEVGASVRFATKPFEREVEVTGPMKLRLWVSSSIDDADVFAIVRNVRPDGTEVVYPGPLPGYSSVAVAYGWLRLSHRKLDAARSTPYRPLHSHDEVEKVAPLEPLAVEIEILPTSAVFERGHRLVLEVDDDDDPRMLFQHDDARDRVPRSKCTVHTGGGFDSHLLLPVIPER